MKYWNYEFLYGGKLVIAEDNGAVCAVSPANCGSPEGERVETALLRKAASQLSEYFAGERREFDLPLAPRGTSFQQAVWEVLKTIPYGETMTYGQVARSVGRPRGAQAVGQAVGANPIPFLIPCHRVIGKHGRLTGFALGLELKERLLDLEQLK